MIRGIDKWRMILWDQQQLVLFQSIGQEKKKREQGSAIDFLEPTPLPLENLLGSFSEQTGAFFD